MPKVGEPRLISSGHGLLEGPVWHPRLGLLAADATVGGVWRFREGEAPALVVPHRRGIGGMVLHERGGVVVGGRNIAYKDLTADGDPPSPTLVLFENDPAAGIVGFNDFTTDPAGRLYVGSLGFVPMHGETGGGKPGALHVIDLDGKPRTLVDDVALTNGLGFSPDGRHLYHADSLRHVVRVYEVAPDGGLGGMRTFARIDDGLPDGLAVDESGTVWVAVAHGNAVVALAPDGSVRQRIAIPVPMVTSVCFGGPERRDLYIFTGSEGSPDLKACIFHLTVAVPGLKLAPARVALPA